MKTFIVVECCPAFLAVFAIACIFPKEGLHAAARAATVENFEAAALPAGWSGDSNGAAEITSERFKSGKQSLRWHWRRPGSVLTGASPGGAVPAAAHLNLGFWLYNEKPMEKILRLELLQSGEVVGRCWYSLNFRGWRPLGAPFRQVHLLGEELAPGGKTRLTYEGFRLIAPRDAAEGRLYIDYVNFQCGNVLRPDNQQPWVDRQDILETNAPEKFIFSSRDISLNRPWLPRFVSEKDMTPEEREGMATIRNRLFFPRGCLPKKDAAALRDFREICQIRRASNGVVTGRPVVPPRGAFNSPPDGIVLYDRLNPAGARKPAVMSPRRVRFYEALPKVEGASADGHPIMHRLAEAYAHEMRANNRAEAAKLKEAFFDLCDHLLDQGFAEGNANCASWCFVPGLIVGMRKELEETGRLRDMLLAAMACGTSYGDGVFMVEDWRKAGIPGDPRNTDGFRNYRELLGLSVLMPDPAERRQRLYAYSRTISLLCDPQLGEPYAWDGTCHHHAMFHPGYSAGALLQQAYDLRGTSFRLTPDAVALLKRSMMLMGFMANAKGILPANCPGYTGVPLGVYSRPEDLSLYSYLDTADRVNGVDPDIAGIYLAFHADNPNPPAKVREFQAMGFTPHKPSGHMSVNGVSIALHRRENWLVSIAGKYKFRRGLEPNYPGSLFNHYSRNGSVFVVSSGTPTCPWASGYSLEGWDPRHYPGTTHYLNESAASLLTRSKGYSENIVGGGTNLDGDGVWGMNSLGQSNPRLRHAGNITFNKSAFCFGNRVTLLTTGIGRSAVADEAERALELATTLWQNAFGSGGQIKGQNLRLGYNTPLKPPPTPPEQEPIWIDGRKIEAFPWEARLPSGTAHWLVDNKRTGYYVHRESPPIRLARREQTWTYPSPDLRIEQPVNQDGRDLRNYMPTKGNFSVAWFEHGVKPETPECVYTLLPNTTPEAMSQFAESMMDSSNPPYRILQKDSQAHVLWDRDSRTKGYVIFDDAWAGEAGNGPAGAADPRSRTANCRLLAVNRPCMVMIKQCGEGLRLSTASTDMDSWTREIRLSGDIVLTLSGDWKPREDAVVAMRENRRTILKIPFRTFMPVVIELFPASSP